MKKIRITAPTPEPPTPPSEPSHIEPPADLREFLREFSREHADAIARARAAPIDVKIYRDEEGRLDRLVIKPLTSRLN